MSLPGIHHITALASDPQRNLRFYTGFLGLRLVKRTVNFDAPDTYHLYYGDEVGRPGTLLTFFPFPDAGRGRRGAGETTAVAFSVPPGSSDFWIDRLSHNGIRFDGPENRFDEECIRFEDPDGMIVELFEDGSAKLPGWEEGPVPPDYSVRKLHGATFTHGDLMPSKEFLSGMMDFEIGQVEGNRHRFFAGSGGARARIDIVVDPLAGRGVQSAGSVHHIAWRVASDDEQREWRTKLVAAGHGVTQVLDRAYFRSVYFREPGGVLFEVATDQPGFAVDEDPHELGTHLKLPQWLEPDRTRIERVLPPLDLSLASSARSSRFQDRTVEK